MEVVFKPNVGADDGLRSLSREQLDFLCTQAKCTILSKISNSHIDAYVLSESSMFIYKTRFIMKTCGTTTLLRYISSTNSMIQQLGNIQIYLSENFYQWLRIFNNLNRFTSDLIYAF
jgi:hypothetical protein